MKKPKLEFIFKNKTIKIKLDGKQIHAVQKISFEINKAGNGEIIKIYFPLSLYNNYTSLGLETKEAIKKLAQISNVQIYVNKQRIV